MKVTELQHLDPCTVTLVDIREPSEVLLESSIPGAINIPMSRIEAEIKTGNLPKDKKIVTICRSGGRCFMVNDVLTAHGYDVDMLEGGMVAYNAAL